MVSGSAKSISSKRVVLRGASRGALTATEGKQAARHGSRNGSPETGPKTASRPTAAISPRPPHGKAMIIRLS